MQQFNRQHFNRLLILAAQALVAGSGFAQTIFTIPQGYTKVAIAGADGPGETKLTSISASLLQPAAYSGSATLGAYTDNPDPALDSQIVNVAGVTWTATQWTTEPYVAYISVADDPGNADGIAPAEEAYLITGNTTDGALTLECEFDLSTRFPASTTITIRRANTLDTFFENLTEPFGGNDVVYLWSGVDWESFQFSGGQWTTIADPFTNVGPITLVRPDEGLFISRASTTPITVTIFGEIPAAPQITNIKSVSFVASRFPIETTLLDSGIANGNWNGNDVVYIWNPNASPSPAWDSYQFSGGNWTTVADPFTPVNDTPIPANSAIFVSRANPVSPANGGTTSKLPYTVE